MFRIININFITGIFYAFIMYVFYSTGYINAKGLTYSNLKYLLVFPLVFITVIFNTFFMATYRNENKKLQYSFQVISIILMILMMVQFIIAPIIFVTFTLGMQVLVHTIDVLLFISLIIMYIFERRRAKTN